jgi:hypothetical protein
MMGRHRKEYWEIGCYGTKEFLVRGCNPDITYVSEIVVMTRSSVTQIARGFIGVSQARNESLLNLTIGDSCVCHRPPHPFRVPIFSVSDQPEPTDILLEFCQCEIADCLG